MKKILIYTAVTLTVLSIGYAAEKSWKKSIWSIQYIENEGDRCYIASGGTNAGVAITCKFK